jgi:ribose 5-phosphate isomerase B
MNKKKRSIAIGADHRGYSMKEFLKKHKEFDTTTVEWQDVGAVDDQRSDYPKYAIRAVAAMREKAADSAVLICGSGIGMAITANRYPGIYAGVVWNADIAAIAKEHDHVNVLVFPSDYVSNEDALRMLQAWLVAQKKDGRYEKRLEMIEEIVI